MLRNKTARQHNFALVPKADLPRSTFAMRQTRKQGFNASELVPIMCEEVLPGDTWQHQESIVARLATPIAPVVDDLHLETFYFWTPNRITYPLWQDLITGTNTSYLVPTVIPESDDLLSIKINAGSALDHFGLMPQTFTVNFAFNRMPLDAYFTIWNEWFRDQNLQDPWEWDHEDPTLATRNYTQDGSRWLQQCLRINKRHDYFTASLPFLQKGTAISMSLAGTAPVVGDQLIGNLGQPQFGPDSAPGSFLAQASGSAGALWSPTPDDTGPAFWRNPALVANLSAVSAFTINQLRVAAMTQQLLERDARGGTRYVENILSHFGARVPDYTAQRPEYLGGSKIPITVNPIAQTAAYDAEPADAASAIGNLGAEMHASGTNRTFTFAATEHGYIIGLAVARATPTYQQGTRKHWRRSTRLDYWWPEFAHIGEQAVATGEIFQEADDSPAVATWGYQERGAEYRYTPNEITGPLRSTATQPLDWWHYAEEFGSTPALNAAFISDKTQETLARSLATAPSAQWSCQIIMDVLHESKVARIMPAYGVPGIDRF